MCLYMCLYLSGGHQMKLISDLTKKNVLFSGCGKRPENIQLISLESSEIKIFVLFF